MIGKAQIRKWLTQEINPIINQYGFKIIPFVGIYGIVKKEETVIKSMLISQDSNDYLGISRPDIRFNIVEDLMFKFTGMEVYRQLNSTFSLALEEMSVITFLQNIITSEADVKAIAEKFNKYFPEVFLPKLIEYSDPVNVLKLWDSLQTVKEKTNFFQGGDKYIKILIISKMAKDSKFQERCESSRQIYTELVKNGEDYQEELALCEKVIKYLESTIL